MDLDPHFGRFFCKQIDFLKSLRVQKCVLPHEVWTLKIVIFPRENTIFYKIHVFASKWKSMENTKKTRHNRFKINVFCDVDFWMTFELTWLDFGPQVGPPKSRCIQVFSQDASKRRPRGSKSVPRASQEPPKRAPRSPKSDQNVPRGRPRCHQGCIFVHFFVCLSFSKFCYVFLCFSAFFCCLRVQKHVANSGIWTPRNWLLNWMGNPKQGREGVTFPETGTGGY